MEGGIAQNLVTAEESNAVEETLKKIAEEAADPTIKKKTKFNPITISLLHKLAGQFAFTYKACWADNADRMSMLYSGTGALKTDYTRTGKRTVREWGK